ncbi:MAG: LysR substrate-binding domain-containing protein [Pseudomonadota bacterium]
MNLPSLKALRAFEAAARYLSFSRAGDELHVTHAAISHQIRLLEDWFGVPLFERHGRSIRLTKEGMTLSHHASKSLSELSFICAGLKATHAKEQIRVGCIPSIASRWLIPNLPKFIDAHPQVDLQISYAQAYEILSSDRFDVLITLGENRPSDMSCEELFSRAIAPVCSPHYLKNRSLPDNPQAMVAETLLHDETKTAWESWFDNAGVSLKSDLSGPIFQDFNLLVTAAIAGHGIALCPVNVFRDDITKGDLKILFESETLSDHSYYLYTSLQPTASVGSFASWFKSIVKNGDDF